MDQERIEQKIFRENESHRKVKPDNNVPYYDGCVIVDKLLKNARNYLSSEEIQAIIDCNLRSYLSKFDESED